MQSILHCLKLLVAALQLLLCSFYVLYILLSQIEAPYIVNTYYYQKLKLLIKACFYSSVFLREWKRKRKNNHVS